MLRKLFKISFFLKFSLLFAFAFVLQTGPGYALNLDKMKTLFLNGQYDESIKEGENILAHEGYSKNMDELYYMLGLSYLKTGNYLRASDIFEIILKEFKDSDFRAEAKLGLGDSYFLKGNFTEAEQQYKNILVDFPEANLKAAVYFRLSQLAIKEGNAQESQNYIKKLKQECPLSPEIRIDKDITSADFFYTVQVGSFSKRLNAQNLVQKLKNKGYAAYLEELETKGRMNFRVRVGRVNSRKEAEVLSKKLTMEGYPTRIFP